MFQGWWRPSLFVLVLVVPTSLSRARIAFTIKSYVGQAVLVLERRLLLTQRFEVFCSLEGSRFCSLPYHPV